MLRLRSGSCIKYYYHYFYHYCHACNNYYDNIGVYYNIIITCYYYFCCYVQVWSARLDVAVQSDESAATAAQPQPHSVTTGYSILIHWHTLMAFAAATAAAAAADDLAPDRLLNCWSAADGPPPLLQCHRNSVLNWLLVARQYMPAGTEHEVSPLGQWPSSSHRGQNRWPRSFHCRRTGHPVLAHRYCCIFRRSLPVIRVLTRRPFDSVKYLVSRSRIEDGILPLGTSRPRRFLLRTHTHTHTVNDYGIRHI